MRTETDDMRTRSLLFLDRVGWRAVLVMPVVRAVATGTGTLRQVSPRGLPDLDVARVRRWCEQRVPAHVRDQVRIECEVAPRHLTIVECRPPWDADPDSDWTRLPVARLRYVKATNRWSLYYRDRNLRFHLYDRLPPAPHIDELLTEIDKDPVNIFWG